MKTIMMPGYNLKITERSRIHQTIINGNITHQVDSITVDSLHVSYKIETTINYLPNPNPFYRIYRSTSLPYFSGLGIGNIDKYFAPANLISQQTSHAGNVSYQYVLRPDGYPATAMMTILNGLKRKLVFENDQP